MTAVVLPYQTRKIDIPGNQDAAVVIVANDEVGTVARVKQNSAYSAYRGTGKDAKHVGNRYRKQEAINLVIGASNRKGWRVLGVSGNTNSFGLYEMFLVAKDGEVWRVLSNALNLKMKGETITADAADGMGWATLGYECPERRTDCPPEIVKEVWKS